MRERTLCGLLACALAAVAPVAATAQPTTSPRELWTPYGEYFLVGGGVTDFVDSSIKNLVNSGGTWDVRLGIGSRFFVGGEVAYVGSARSAGDLGTNLATHGVEAVLRLQYPMEADGWLFTPFAFGGGGWTHFHLSHPRGLTLQDHDDVAVVPAGAGVTLGHNHVLFDTRFTYRQTFGENLIRGGDGSAASLKSWAIVASVGYEF